MHSPSDTKTQVYSVDRTEEEEREREDLHPQLSPLWRCAAACSSPARGRRGRSAFAGDSQLSAAIFLAYDPREVNARIRSQISPGRELFWARCWWRAGYTAAIVCTCESRATTVEIYNSDVNLDFHPTTVTSTIDDSIFTCGDSKQCLQGMTLKKCFGCYGEIVGLTCDIKIFVFEDILEDVHLTMKINIL